MISEDSTLHAELEARLRFETLIAKTSSHFINLPAEEIDAHIQQVLGQVATFLGFNLAAITQFSEQSSGLEVTHIWTAAGLPSIPPGYTQLDFPWIGERIAQGQGVYLTSLDVLPLEAQRDRQTYEQHGVQSIYNWPLQVGGAVVGALSFASVAHAHGFPTDFAQGLELLAQVFGSTLARARADQALRESEARLSMAADAAMVGLWSLDIGTGCFWLTAKTRELFGFAAEEVVTFERFMEFVHSEDRPLVQQTVQAIMQARNQSSVEYRILRPDGSLRWMASCGSVRCNASATPHSLMGVSVDITERKRSEEALRQSLTEIQRLKDRLQAESDYLKAEIKVTQAHREIIGQGPAIRQVLSQVEQVAPTDSSVLICGATGTGKELIAQAIHQLSPRRGHVMVKVNCAALPSALVESELFGREKGAFTGALTLQVGRFEVADGSTIFLDEIGELSLEVQAKLLRVLQEGRLERLGSPRTIQVNVRVIAATNRDLADHLRKGLFREDLYYRLNVFPIRVPPLRERAEDIPLLVWAFLEEFSSRMGKKITQVPRKTMEALQRHSWPGNVRELRNVIEHGAIVTSGETLRVPMLENAAPAAKPTQTLADSEREHILKSLERTGWRIKGPRGAAVLLGLNPSTLYSRMQKLGIPHRRQKEDAAS